MFSLFSSEPLATGTAAPAFVCADDRGRRFDLASQRGKKVVLVFYPADNTPVCTRQLCELRDDYESLRQAGAVVRGVNPGSAEKHAGFRGKYGFPFPLLADQGRRVAKLYRSSGLIIKRTVYVIDEEGMIIYAQRGKPPVSEILEAVHR